MNAGPTTFGQPRRSGAGGAGGDPAAAIGQSAEPAWTLPRRACSGPSPRFAAARHARSTVYRAIVNASGIVIGTGSDRDDDQRSDQTACTITPRAVNGIVGIDIGHVAAAIHPECERRRGADGRRQVTVIARTTAILIDT